MSDPFAGLATPITVILGLAGLGGFIWNMIKGYNKRQTEIANDRKIEDEKKEAIIKKDLEIRGEQIRKDAIEQAAGVKKEVESTARTIKSDLETTASNLREHNSAMNDLLKTAIREVDDKVMKMLKDLSDRANLTNGNVGLIRNEVQDVKEDVQDLWDRLDDTDNVLGVESKTPDQKARRKREQDFNRRRKRREIQQTAEDQGAGNRRYEDDMYEKGKDHRIR